VTKIGNKTATAIFV